MNMEPRIPLKKMIEIDALDRRCRNRYTSVSRLAKKTYRRRVRRRQRVEILNRLQGW